MATNTDQQNNILSELNNYKTQFLNKSKNIDENSNYKIYIKELDYTNPNYITVETRLPPDLERMIEDVQNYYYIYFENYKNRYLGNIPENTAPIVNDIHSLLVKTAYDHFTSIHRKARWQQNQEMFLIKKWRKSYKLEQVIVQSTPLRLTWTGTNMFIYNTFKPDNAEFVMDFRDFNAVTEQDINRVTDEEIKRQFLAGAKLKINVSEISSKIYNTGNMLFMSSNNQMVITDNPADTESLNYPILKFNETLETIPMFSNQTGVPYISLMNSEYKLLQNQLKQEIEDRLLQFETTTRRIIAQNYQPDISYEIEQINKARQIAISDEYRLLFDNPSGNYSQHNLPGYKQLIHNVKGDYNIDLSVLANTYYDTTKKNINYKDAGIYPYNKEKFSEWLLLNAIIPEINRLNFTILGNIATGIRGYVLNFLKGIQEYFQNMITNNVLPQDIPELSTVYETYRSFNLGELNFMYNNVPLVQEQDGWYSLTSPINYQIVIDEIQSSMDRKIQRYTSSTAYTKTTTNKAAPTKETYDEIINNRAYLIFDFADNVIGGEET